MYSNLLLKAFVGPETSVLCQCFISRRGDFQLYTIIVFKGIHIFDILVGLKPVRNVMQTGYLQITLTYEIEFRSIRFDCIVKLFVELYSTNDQDEITKVQT